MISKREMPVVNRKIQGNRRIKRANGFHRAWLIADQLKSVAGQRRRLLDAGFNDPVVVETKKVGMKGQHSAQQRWTIVLAGGDVAAQVNLQVHLGHERACVVMRNTATV